MRVRFLGTDLEILDIVVGTFMSHEYAGCELYPLAAGVTRREAWAVQSLDADFGVATSSFCLSGRKLMRGRHSGSLARQRSRTLLLVDAPCACVTCEMMETRACHRPCDRRIHVSAQT